MRKSKLAPTASRENKKAELWCFRLWSLGSRQEPDLRTLGNMAFLNHDKSAVSSCFLNRNQPWAVTSLLVTAGPAYHFRGWGRGVLWGDCWVRCLGVWLGASGSADRHLTLGEFASSLLPFPLCWCALFLPPPIPRFGLGGNSRHPNGGT